MSDAFKLHTLHRRRLRDVWRSAGWPCCDMVEVELLAAGLLKRVRAATEALSDVTVQSIPSFNCYETVEETFAAAQGFVPAKPNLASWIDVGDSGEKTQRAGGYDRANTSTPNVPMTSNRRAAACYRAARSSARNPTPISSAVAMAARSPRSNPGWAMGIAVHGVNQPWATAA